MKARTRADEALDFYIKATGEDGVQRCQALMQATCGDFERDGKRAEEVRRPQDKKEQAVRVLQKTSGL